MDADQDAWRNPFGMDEECRNCPGLCGVRDRVVHGYGDVGADFLFVGEAPSAGAERSGVPFTGEAGGERLQHVLGLLGLSNSLPASDEPELENTYLTYLTRCRHPERPPADAEVDTCEPYLNADIRMINPEILIPVGERALRALGEEYTTNDVSEVPVEDVHATTIRGRGFALVPMVHPDHQTDAQTDAFVEHFSALMERDYRQTKGRQKR